MKSQKALKSVVTFVAALSIVCALPAFSFAGSLPATKPSSETFTKSWTRTVEANPSEGGHVILTYGFNTVLINEDFAYSYYDGAPHRSKVINGNGPHDGPEKNPREWSDLEVRHSGATVKYYSIW